MRTRVKMCGATSLACAFTIAAASQCELSYAA